MREPQQVFFPLGKAVYKEKRPGVLLKTITGERSQLCLVELAPGTETHHAHENDQIGYVLAGEAVLTVGDATHLLEAGDGYRIPAYVQHSFTVRATSRLKYIEVFCPPKPENDI